MIGLDDAARAYLKTPFRHQGRTPRGCDCIGLLVMALIDCGRPVSDSTTYGKDPTDGRLEREMEREFGPRISKTEMRAGDMVAIEFEGPVRHVGIIGNHPQGGFTLIHTDSSLKEVTEHIIDKRWMNRIKGVWR